jgi:hypothetical protein
MQPKCQIRAEGWGPNGPHVVDDRAPAIYYSPETAKGRYSDQWTTAVYALFERLSASGWEREREAAGGHWWEQVFVRPVAAAAWGPDPTGRHQQRYFDGKNWTEHVADSGVQTTDAFDTRKS